MRFERAVPAIVATAALNGCSPLILNSEVHAAKSIKLGDDRQHVEATLGECDDEYSWTTGRVYHYGHTLKWIRPKYIIVIQLQTTDPEEVDPPPTVIDVSVFERHYSLPEYTHPIPSIFE